MFYLYLFLLVSLIHFRCIFTDVQDKQVSIFFADVKVVLVEQCDAIPELILHVMSSKTSFDWIMSNMKI